MSDTETAELEAIVNNTELSTNTEIPMNDPAPPEIQARAPQTPEEYEFDYEGQKIKASKEKLLKWASMGYGAPNKIGALQKQINESSGRLKQLEQYEKTYKPIDEWAAQNPDKWQTLFDNWRQAQFGAGITPPAAGQAPLQLPPEVLQELQASREFRESQIQERQTLKVKAADQSLDQEVVSIRKSYPNLDFDAPDERGNSLEYQILEHATKHGIPSFRAAFRDYCFDQLGKLTESKARGQGAVNPKTTAALLGKEPAASRGSKGLTPEFLRTRNYDQIHEAVLLELGLASG